MNEAVEQKQPETGGLHDRVVEVLRTIYDPEIPVNIYDLGLIYDLEVDEAGKVRIRMTLTAPACPFAGTLPGQVEMATRGVEGVTDVQVELVWDPPWSQDRMTEEAKLQLGLL
ncbi:MAG TPA: SUF system Fe-S cluster assembly protein [Thiolapillus brandeum]|uniref:SUF system Fe-S cluster assembly protein n=1 Tax=Thiolapillus brandeum TaxID=1076588 RepID=A0A7C5N7T9_9GAMM|nr:SUF system Fe-S cluster assembly protein [Thiolapillus brandeum]